jgi:hypothetical protein
VLLATIAFRGQLGSPAWPTFDLHHADAALSEYDANEADDDKLIDAGEDTGRGKKVQPVSQVIRQLQRTHLAASPPLDGTLCRRKSHKCRTSALRY